MSHNNDDGDRHARNHNSETKDAAKTTELMAYAGCLLAIIATALVVGRDGEGADPVSALDALRLLTWLTIGYMVSRGLAKAGSRSKYQD